MLLSFRPPVRASIAFSAAALALGLSGCGPAAKPSDAEISAYLARGAPGYVTLGAITTHFDATTDADGAALPSGSWRVTVDISAKAQQDLFALAPNAASRRLDFDRGVTEAEQYRIRRIEAVNAYAAKMGLMTQGAASPEPVLPVVLTNKAGDILTEHVTLIAEPDGSAWKFVPVADAAHGTSAVGAPMDLLRQQNAPLTLVTADSSQDRDSLAREQAFLKVLAKAPKP
jgi:hypothetical protein